LCDVFRLLEDVGTQDWLVIPSGLSTKNAFYQVLQWVRKRSAQLVPVSCHGSTCGEYSNLGSGTGQCYSSSSLRYRRERRAFLRIRNSDWFTSAANNYNTSSIKKETESIATMKRSHSSQDNEDNADNADSTGGGGSSVASGDAESDLQEFELDPDKRREVRKMRRVMANRRSARESRERRKKLLTDLQESVESLTSENKSLTKENLSLRRELASLIEQSGGQGSLNMIPNIQGLLQGTQGLAGLSAVPGTASLPAANGDQATRKL
jgi:hypothetical protein